MLLSDLRVRPSRTSVSTGRGGRQPADPPHFAPAAHPRSQVPRSETARDYAQHEYTQHKQTDTPRTTPTRLLSPRDIFIIAQEETTTPRALTPQHVAPSEPFPAFNDPSKRVGTAYYALRAEPIEVLPVQDASGWRRDDTARSEPQGHDGGGGRAEEGRRRDARLVAAQAHRCIRPGLEDGSVAVDEAEGQPSAPKFPAVRAGYREGRARRAR